MQIFPIILRWAYIPIWVKSIRINIMPKSGVPKFISDHRFQPLAQVEAQNHDNPWFLVVYLYFTPRAYSSTPGITLLFLWQASLPKIRPSDLSRTLKIIFQNLLSSSSISCWRLSATICTQKKAFSIWIIPSRVLEGLEKIQKLTSGEHQ